MQPNKEHKSPAQATSWLPITAKEVQARGWDSVDIVIVSGDAYVDHPSFGTAVVGRLLEKEGLRVAIVAQPNWQDDLRDFKKFGRPNLFFAVTAGCMDAMVNHYTAGRRRRSDDAYTPGGEAGFRPDYATVTYSNILKDLYPDVPVVIGGIEASLRRVTHYDYWSDTLKPAILAESRADLLVYGMGEQPLIELVRLVKRGVPFSNLTTIKQTAVLVDKKVGPPPAKKWKDQTLAGHEECLADKKKFAANFKHIERESNKQKAKRLLQPVGDKLLVINPPYPVMKEKEIDRSFDLPYTRMPHPKYRKRGPIPAYEMIKFSVNMHRGCFGGCSFCTISAHQGKLIASRSEKSILKEVAAITEMEDFKGYISDLGGPSGNMYKMQGFDQDWCDRCSAPSCIYPKICPNLDINHKPMLDIYRKVNEMPGIKKAFVSSGLRYDLFLPDEKTIAKPMLKEYKDKFSHIKNEKARTEKALGAISKDNYHEEYLEDLVAHHVSGRLKVAPEHLADDTLDLMRKPGFHLFAKLKEKFTKLNEKYGLRQQLIPYFISSHPGSTVPDMAELAVATKELGFKLEQVQDFTPTPMTVATVIYYSGYHPYTMKKIFTAKSKSDKQNQRRFFFWYKKENKNSILTELENAGRKDLADRLLK